MSFHARLSQIIHTQQLITPDAPLIVGVSGGADSLALLHALKVLEIAPLHAATLDHGLRGEAGRADAEYVLRLCDAWGIPATMGQAHLDPYAPALEARARRARYDFLAQVARDHGTQQVAVAHHADDQAETVLLRLIRGTALHGLRAMQVRGPLPGAPEITLVRPLLRFTRAEISAYCAAHGITPRHDATNDDTHHARAYVRHQLMPALKTLNPQAAQALNRLADSAAHDDAYMQSALEQATRAHTKLESARVMLARAVFDALHPALRRRWILQAARTVNAHVEFSQERIDAAEALLLRGEVSTVIELGGGVRARRGYTHVIVESEAALTASSAPVGTLLISSHLAVVLPIGQPAPINDTTTILLTLAAADSRDARATLRIPHGAALMLRTRRTGDRFAPAGLEGHTQTLKKWMIDHKIPRDLRDRVALITVNDTVAAICWGARWPISHAVTIGEAGCDDIRITLRLML